MTDTASTAEAGERAPLSREAIVRAAVALADESGVQALTMRSLAARLGYEVMSLYNHVANKAELLEGAVDAVAAEIPRPGDAALGVDADADPLAAVRAIAVATHEVYRAHPWAPDLWATTMPGPHRMRRMDDSLRLFARSGLSDDLAHHGFHAVSNHVVGYTIQELAMASSVPDLDAAANQVLDSLPVDEFPHMVEHIHLHLRGEASSSFELVLDLILDGLVRLDAAGHHS